MSALNDWVAARRDRLTWLDCDRYVWSVFAGAPERWHDDPGTMIGATAQAQKLLQSDVLAVDLLGSFSRHLVIGSSAAEICAALEEEQPRRDLITAADAMLHQFAGHVDVVLDCPSPRKLLGEGQDVGFDALDDVATALLQVVRAVADRPLQGLRISCDTKGGPDEDELDSWSSLVAAARHYHWVTVIRLDGVTDADQLDATWPGDLLLLGNLEADMVPDDRRLGAGLPPAAWTETNQAVLITEAAGKRGFRFGEIPHDAAPETVLDRIKALH
jgi:hypothetical protein